MKHILVEWDDEGDVVDLHRADDASSVEVRDNVMTRETASYVEVLADVWGNRSDDRSARLFEKFYSLVPA